MSSGVTNYAQDKKHISNTFDLVINYKIIINYERATIQH